MGIIITADPLLSVFRINVVNKPDNLCNLGKNNEAERN
jgi:hypothetical protein